MQRPQMLHKHLDQRESFISSFHVTHKNTEVESGPWSSQGFCQLVTYTCCYLLLLKVLGQFSYFHVLLYCFSGIINRIWPLWLDRILKGFPNSQGVIKSCATLDGLIYGQKVDAHWTPMCYCTGPSPLQLGRGMWLVLVTRQSARLSLLGWDGERNFKTSNWPGQSPLQ